MTVGVRTATACSGICWQEVSMPVPLEIAVTERLAGTTLTFAEFGRATCGLPPAMRLAEFLLLPSELQAQAWTALRVELDAGDDLARAA
jgi:hypothetical protein